MNTATTYKYNTLIKKRHHYHTTFFKNRKRKRQRRKEHSSNGEDLVFPHSLRFNYEIPKTEDAMVQPNIGI